MVTRRVQSAQIRTDATIRETIVCINETELGIALVIDENSCLLGSVTDGDIRRALLRGLKLDATVDKVMNQNPLTCLVDTPFGEIKRKMSENKVRQMPITEASGEVVDLVFEEDKWLHTDVAVEAIIMAGGIGQRLRPLTENVPKPMLEVKGQPILERIIEDLRAQGICKITICVNYLGHMIEDYFGDGSKHGVSITYTRETRRMGTGGALSLLEDRPAGPCIVMNGDIITKLDFGQLLAFHHDHNAVATIALNEYSVTVPFGVVEIENGMATGLVEKPTHSFFVNAGIYMLSPESFDFIEKDTEFDMTDLVTKMMNQGAGVTGFPVFEYWLDVGRHDDLALARSADDA